MKIKITLPEKSFEEMGITEDTLFITGYENGEIYIETYDEEEILDENSENDDYNEEIQCEFEKEYERGYINGIINGYKDGYACGTADAYEAYKGKRNNCGCKRSCYEGTEKCSVSACSCCGCKNRE